MLANFVVFDGKEKMTKIFDIIVNKKPHQKYFLIELKMQNQMNSRRLDELVECVEIKWTMENWKSR